MMQYLARFSLICGLACLLSLQAHADPVPRADVRVLIDISGSMKQNDPHNLRKPALEMLVQLFPKDAKVGVWTFGQDVQVLAPHQVIGDGWRTESRRKSSQITSTSLYTNIPAALDAAAYDLERLDKNFRPSVILLTDGMVDISKSPADNAAARRRVLDDILPRLRKAGVVVHAVALSKSADRELMERLAVDTNGLFAVAETADELNRVFLQAFDAAAPAEQVPLSGNRFLVDSSIDELTALVFHPGKTPLTLASPDGKRHSAASHGDDVKWFQGQGFDLITVTKPFEGEWNIVGDLEKGSRVTIVSNLSLSASRLAENLFVSNNAPEVTAALKQQENVLKEPALLKLVKLTAAVQRREDGKQWQVELAGEQPVPADGFFRAKLPMLTEPGNYELAIEADGKTFQRRQKQTVAVRDNFDVRVKSTDAIPPVHQVTLFARNPAVDAGSCVVKAQIKAPDGASSAQDVAASGDREWQLALDSQGQAGRFEVVFEVTGKYRSGDKFTYRSATVSVDQSGSKVVAAAPPPQEEPAAKPGPKPEPKKSEPAAEHPPKAAEPEHAPAAAAEPPKKSWQKYLLYGGLALGNLLILGLGYFAFRMIMGGGKSSVLESADEEAEDEEGDKDDKKGKKAEGGKDKGKGKDEGGGKPKRAKPMDLPDDAIDIDPAADKKK